MPGLEIVGIELFKYLPSLLHFQNTNVKRNDLGKASIIFQDQIQAKNLTNRTLAQHIPIQRQSIAEMSYCHIHLGREATIGL